MFKGFYAALKPGGVLGVEEHRAKQGATMEETFKSGYLPEDYVIKLATDAGFKLDKKSEINANPRTRRTTRRRVDAAAFAHAQGPGQGQVPRDR
jgi:predicted methyltransferase